MRLSKYECARVIGARATQLANNAQSTLADASGSFADVAMQELVRGVLPLVLRRKRPGDTDEIIDLSNACVTLPSIYRGASQRFGEAPLPSFTFVHGVAWR